MLQRCEQSRRSHLAATTLRRSDPRNMRRNVYRCGGFYEVLERVKGIEPSS
jgi:hypothetical protein